MNIQDMNELLTHVQLIDNRRIGDATVIEWHKIIGDLDYAPSLEAARMHFRESTAYLTPAHIRANVDRIRHAVARPEDEFGNPLDPDTPALEAQVRLALATVPKGLRS